MNQLFSIAMILFVAASASGADPFTRDTEQVSIATTGRIAKIDVKNRILKVRATDGHSLSIRSVSQNFAQVMQGLKKRIGVTLPGGITIALPGRNKTASKPAEQKSSNIEEYIVIVTEDTVFQDGGETLRFEDFRNGEMVSIHGVLSGGTLTASRIAKWF